MIQVLTDHWGFVIELVSGVAVVVALFYRLEKGINELKTVASLNQTSNEKHFKHLEAEVARVEDELRDHISAPLPHKLCPSHSVLIEDMHSIIKELHSDVRELRKEVKDILIQVVKGNLSKL